MRTLCSNNGHILAYSGRLYPATRDNEITYERFCFMGAIGNERLCRITHQRGTHVYDTYHDMSLYGG